MANILIVDDAAFMRMMLRTMLAEAGHQVIGEGENGLEAVKLYKSARPDVVTMDITMPEMDGIMAVKEILRFDPKAKIIMCSAMGQKQMVIDSLTSGAKDFLVKPFQKEKVMESIAKVLGV